MNPLQIAVVGLCRMGKRHVHTLLYRVPRAKIVAVCSTDPNEIKWAKKIEEYQDSGIVVYNNYDEMLAHPGLQAVLISTSTDVHASQSLAAIAKGVHVLCEKPLSTDLAEHFRFAQLLLTAEDPHLEGANRATHRKAEAQVRSLVLNICGIALCHQRVQPTLVNAVIAITLYGEYFTNPEEREALLGIINTTGNIRAWPMRKQFEIVRRR